MKKHRWKQTHNLHPSPITKKLPDERGHSKAPRASGGMGSREPPPRGEDFSNPLAPPGSDLPDSEGAPSTLDPSGVVELIRTLVDSDPSSSPSVSARAREEAGESLWDLTAVREHASFLATHLLPEAIGAVLAHPDTPDRVRELSLGCLANVMCHGAERGGCPERLGVDASLASLAASALFESRDPPTLIQTCRLFAAAVRPETRAAAWRAVCVGDDAFDAFASRVSLLAVVTARADLLAAALGCLAALARVNHEGISGRRGVVRAGAFNLIATTLHPDADADPAREALALLDAALAVDDEHPGEDVLEARRAGCSDGMLRANLVRTIARGDSGGFAAAAEALARLASASEEGPGAAAAATAADSKAMARVRRAAAEEKDSDARDAAAYLEAIVAYEKQRGAASQTKRDAPEDSH